MTDFVDTGCEGWPCYRGTYIDYRPLPKDGKRTWTWQIFTTQADVPMNAKRGLLLGEVKWFGRWCKYCFFPAADCVFEATCLREIADFIEQRTDEHRNAIFKGKSK